MNVSPEIDEPSGDGAAVAIGRPPAARTTGGRGVGTGAWPGPTTGAGPVSGGGDDDVMVAADAAVVGAGRGLLVAGAVGGRSRVPGDPGPAASTPAAAPASATAPRIHRPRVGGRRRRRASPGSSGSRSARGPPSGDQPPRCSSGLPTAKARRPVGGEPRRHLLRCAHPGRPPSVALGAPARSSRAPGRPELAHLSAAPTSRSTSPRPRSGSRRAP